MVKHPAQLLYYEILTDQLFGKEVYFEILRVILMCYEEKMTHLSRFALLIIDNRK